MERETAIHLGGDRFRSDDPVVLILILSGEERSYQASLATPYRLRSLFLHNSYTGHCTLSSLFHTSTPLYINSAKKRNVPF